VPLLRIRGTEKAAKRSRLIKTTNLSEEQKLFFT
jgi:hypothetical protein